MKIASVENLRENQYNCAMKILFENVSLSFGRLELFKNLNAEIHGGKVYGITGRNGAGKSTFLKLAGKIIKPDGGEVKIFNAESVAAVTPELKIYEDLTALENLQFFAKLRNKNIDAENIFRRVNLSLENLNVRAGNFSTGMKQRLKFGILLSVDADIWLLDEPTANLDDAGRQIFYSEITTAAKKIILLATNDKSDLEVCNEIISLR